MKPDKEAESLPGGKNLVRDYRSFWTKYFARAAANEKLIAIVITLVIAVIFAATVKYLAGGW